MKDLTNDMFQDVVNAIPADALAARIKGNARVWYAFSDRLLAVAQDAATYGGPICRGMPRILKGRTS
jgi:hypothetical protein